MTPHKPETVKVKTTWTERPGVCFEGADRTGPTWITLGLYHALTNGGRIGG